MRPAGRCGRGFPGGRIARPARTGRRRAPRDPAGNIAHRLVAIMPVISLMRASSAARRSGVSKPPPSVSRIQSMSASGRAGRKLRSIASRPPERTRSSGSCPSGRSATQRLPGWRRQREVDRAVGRAAAGAVAVEAEHRLVGHLPQQAELVFGQRGAERRDRRLESPPSPSRSRRHSPRPRSRWRPHARPGARPRRCRASRPCGRAGSPGEFRYFAGASVERAAAEGDDAPAQIGDREHHAVAEAVVGHRDVVARDQQPGLDHVLGRTPCAPRCSFSAKRSGGA